MTADGSAVPNTVVRLRAEYAGRTDSTESRSDSRGLFSLSIDAPGLEVPRISLRVIPPERTGYLVLLSECQPVMQWGDACVLPPVVSEPSLPIFRFRDRTDETAVAQARVTFRRTGGAMLFTRGAEGAPTPVDSLTAVTDHEGITNLFPVAVWAGSMDPVVGEMTVDLPPPRGRVVQRGYAISPSAFYTTRALTTYFVGTDMGTATSHPRQSWGTR